MTSSRQFNSNGDLILHSDTIEEFKQFTTLWKEHKGRILTCPHCGHEWRTRRELRNIRTCNACGTKILIEVEK